jgi:hypothetical protein
MNTATRISFFTADNQVGIETNADFARIITRAGVLSLEIGDADRSDLLATWTPQGWRIAPGSRAAGKVFPYVSFSAVSVR